MLITENIIHAEDITNSIDIIETALYAFHNVKNLTKDQSDMCAKNARMALSYIRGYVAANNHA